MDMTKMSKACCEKMAPYTFLLFRIVLGLLFLTQGIYKLINIKMVVGMLTTIGLPAPEVFAWILALVEAIGGLLLIIGLYTHFAILPLLVVMLVAFFTVHLKDGLWTPRSLPGWTVILAFFGLLAIGCNSWGVCSVDAVHTKKSKK